MTEPTAESTLAEWVTRKPQAAPILERHGLDYCCGGRRTLADACAQRNLSVPTVVAELHAEAASAVPSNDRSPVTDWSQQSLTALCDHIEQTHHAWLRQQLPRLEQLVAKVVAAHGERHPELAALQSAFRALAAELGPHLLKEEQILFPAIRRLEHDSIAPHFPFGTVRNPIQAMEHEHDTAGRLLGELRSLTDGYHPPSDACTSWRELLRGLRELELDLHQHIHKENNLLFPAAAALEAR